MRRPPDSRRAVTAAMPGETALVPLAEPRLAQGPTLLVQEGRRDADDLIRRHLDAGPVGAAVGPAVVEEASLAVGRREADQAAAGDGQHRTNGAVQVVRDA